MSSFHSNSNVEFSENDSMANDALYHGCGIKDSYLSFDGPVRGSESDSKNGDFVIAREVTHKTKRLNKRASRFSQINNNIVL